ncbi:sensor histidine kinase [Mucilaginibacter sp. SG564]|uniref:sensor histidine kinase n=1 Tax=unclassified Mucilaginibacter TaxID=2617802 RepID=UPI0015570474|nr:sensor histidine kinase [Mucilaginibacter sp. SG564]NOW98260.1 sensor histidine kinase YesM [Mucilaginibacter sp. SG564]
MKLKKPGTTLLQLLIWVAVLLLIFFSALPMDGPRKSVISTIISTLSYAIIIYGNILFLYPIFYQKRKFVWYGVLVVLLLVVVGMLRGYISIIVYQYFSIIKPVHISFWRLLYYVPSGILIYILSLIFRISIAYFTLKQQTEEIMLQKSQAELNLLKSQVQPHFLFNTLNNIYYKVYKVDPPSANLIERLSDIMRYFVDESPKDVVPLSTEVAFIENYMALERIRIRYGVIINFEKAYQAELRIPPMLLMTFVENIFKHGINKSSKQNQIDISLVQKGGYLLFSTSNRWFNSTVPTNTNGFGISNLSKRLSMLYGSNFELTTQKNGELYLAFLKIPLL